MSFILESNGQEFCDWRFSISRTCQDSSFFAGVQTFSIASVFFQGVIMLSCLLLRHFGLKETLKSFTFGPNGALLIFFVVMVFWLTMNFIVLLAQDPVAGEIIWGFCMPLPYSPLFVYLATLLKAFPEVFVGNNNQALLSLVSSTKWRNIWLGLFLSFMTWINLALHVAAAVLIRDGHVEVGSKVAQAATILVTINIALFVGLFMFVSRHFLVMISQRMVSLEEDSKSKDKETRARIAMMEIITKKIRGNIFSSVSNSVLLMLYHILLSAYPEFFSNLPFSKAMSVIFVAILPSASLPMVCMYLVVDIQRVRYRIVGSTKTRTTQGKSHQSKEIEIEEIIEKNSSEMHLQPSPPASEAVMNNFLSSVGGK